WVVKPRRSEGRAAVAMPKVPPESRIRPQPKLKDCSVVVKDLCSALPVEYRRSLSRRRSVSLRRLWRARRKYPWLRDLLGLRRKRPRTPFRKRDRPDPQKREALGGRSVPSRTDFVRTPSVARDLRVSLKRDETSGKYFVDPRDVVGPRADLSASGVVSSESRDSKPFREAEDKTGSSESGRGSERRGSSSDLARASRDTEKGGASLHRVSRVVERVLWDVIRDVVDPSASEMKKKFEMIVRRRKNEAETVSPNGDVASAERLDVVPRDRGAKSSECVKTSCREGDLVSSDDANVVSPNLDGRSPEDANAFSSNGDTRTDASAPSQDEDSKSSEEAKTFASGDVESHENAKSESRIGDARSSDGGHSVPLRGDEEPVADGATTKSENRGFGFYRDTLVSPTGVPVATERMHRRETETANVCGSSTGEPSSRAASELRSPKEERKEEGTRDRDPRNGNDSDAARKSETRAERKGSSTRADAETRKRVPKEEKQPKRKAHAVLSEEEVLRLELDLPGFNWLQQKIMGGGKDQPPLKRRRSEEEASGISHPNESEKGPGGASEAAPPSSGQISTLCPQSDDEMSKKEISVIQMTVPEAGPLSSVRNAISPRADAQISRMDIPVIQLTIPEGLPPTARSATTHPQADAETSRKDIPVIQLTVPPPFQFADLQNASIVPDPTGIRCPVPPISPPIRDIYPRRYANDPVRSPRIPIPRWIPAPTGQDFWTYMHGVRLSGPLVSQSIPARRGPFPSPPRSNALSEMEIWKVRADQIYNGFRPVLAPRIVPPNREHLVPSRTTQSRQPSRTTFVPDERSSSKLAEHPESCYPTALVREAQVHPIQPSPFTKSSIERRIPVEERPNFAPNVESMTSYADPMRNADHGERNPTDGIRPLDADGKSSDGRRLPQDPLSLAVQSTIANDAENLAPHESPGTQPCTSTSSTTSPQTRISSLSEPTVPSEVVPSRREESEHADGASRNGGTPMGSPDIIIVGSYPEEERNISVVSQRKRSYEGVDGSRAPLKKRFTGSSSGNPRPGFGGRRENGESGTDEDSSGRSPPVDESHPHHGRNNVHAKIAGMQQEIELLREENRSLSKKLLSVLEQERDRFQAPVPHREPVYRSRPRIGSDDTQAGSRRPDQRPSSSDAQWNGPTMIPCSDRDASAARVRIGSSSAPSVIQSQQLAPSQAYLSLASETSKRQDSGLGFQYSTHPDARVKHVGLHGSYAPKNPDEEEIHERRFPVATAAPTQVFDNVPPNNPWSAVVARKYPEVPRAYMLPQFEMASRGLGFYAMRPQVPGSAMPNASPFHAPVQSHAQGSGRPRYPCSFCQQPARFICSVCKKRWYCNAECQERDWHSVHRHECALSSAPVAN
ncbi:unnamed protein product, partial [Darwinula stevensoni]